VLRSDVEEAVHLLSGRDKPSGESHFSDWSSLVVTPEKTSRREKSFKTVSFMLFDISVFLTPRIGEIRRTPFHCSSI